MAIDRVPSLKRCRALGLETAVVGLAKSSKRQPKRSGRKVSEYGMQLKEKQKAKFFFYKAKVEILNWISKNEIVNLYSWKAVK